MVIAVRVKPGASRTKVGGLHGDALVIAVTAPPIDGRATEAARRALADALGIRPSTVSLRSGATSRDKLFTITDPPADLPARLAALRAGPTTTAALRSDSANVAAVRAGSEDGDAATTDDDSSAGTTGRGGRRRPAHKGGRRSTGLGAAGSGAAGDRQGAA